MGCLPLVLTAYQTMGHLIRQTMPNHPHEFPSIVTARSTADTTRGQYNARTTVPAKVLAKVPTLAY